MRLLISREVEFLLVGGYAVGFQGYPRATLDIDLWIRRTPENADRLVAALRDFGFGASAQAAMFLDPMRVVRMGHPPNRVALLTGIDGVEFDDCASRAVHDVLDGVALTIIGLDDLKANKRASGRYRDLNDLEHLA